VIATALDGTRWAFALKTLSEAKAENAAKNLVRNIKKGAEQITRAECDKGIVVVNLKNVLDHDGLRASGVYWGWEAAQRAIMVQIDNILQPFYAREAVELVPIFARKSVVAPLVILVAHTTAVVRPPGRNSIFTELKTMLAMPVPTPDEPSVGTLGREAVHLAEVFQHLVQVVI
jgi:hypothetical protein